MHRRLSIIKHETACITCEGHLSEFARINGWVFGPRGGASDDVHLFIEHLAERGAAVKWQSMGARSYREAKDVIRQRVRRSLGITAIRAAARLKCDRLGLALGNGKDAAKRRKRAKNYWRRWDEEYSQRFGPKAFAGGQPTR